MDVSPKTLREVEFREKKVGGYHHEDVDNFLEQVAAGLEVIQERLRQAVERAQRAEAAASDAGGSDETLKRTLVLAQRTADLAVQEAREQAARILAGAEQQAQGMLAETEERARRTHDDALSGIRSELAALESARQRAQSEVDAMHRWIDDHRAHLTSSLKDALSAVERAGAVSPPPTSTPIDLPRAAIAPAAPAPTVAAPTPSPAPAGPSAVSDNGPETAVWRPGPEELALPTGEVPSVGARRPIIDVDGPPRSDETINAEEQALDDFFEDGEYADERRFGGRLRRRR